MTQHHSDNVSSMRRPPVINRLLNAVPAACREEIARLLLDWLAADWRLTAPSTSHLPEADRTKLQQHWQQMYNRLMTSEAAENVQGDLLRDLLTTQVTRFDRRELAEYLARVARRDPTTIDIGETHCDAETKSLPEVCCGGG